MCDSFSAVLDDGDNINRKERKGFAKYRKGIAASYFRQNFAVPCESFAFFSVITELLLV
jgi:hypothetical protein